MYDINLVFAWTLPWEKSSWKEYIKETICGKYYAEIMAKAAAMPSLKWLDLQMCQPRKPHIIWDSCKYNLAETHKAIIRAKLLTGTYMLQANAAKFKEHLTPICPLCKSEEEDVIHFTLQCQVLEDSRTGEMETVLELLGQLVTLQLGKKTSAG